MEYSDRQNQNDETKTGEQPGVGTTPLQQTRLETAFNKMQSEMQSFYSACINQVQESYKRYKQLESTKIPDMQNEIDKLKQQIPVERVLNKIGFELAKLYDAVYYSSKQSFDKNELEALVEGLNSEFNNVGIKPIYSYKENDPNIEVHTYNRGDIPQGVKLDKVGFIINNAKTIPATFLKCSNAQQPVREQAVQGEQYLFNEGTDFIIHENPSLGGSKKYYIKLVSTDVREWFKQYSDSLTLELDASHPLKASYPTKFGDATHFLISSEEKKLYILLYIPQRKRWIKQFFFSLI